MNSHQELSQKIQALERRYDGQFKVVFSSIQKLIQARPKELIQVSSPKKKLVLEENRKDKKIISKSEQYVYQYSTKQFEVKILIIPDN